MEKQKCYDAFTGTDRENQPVRIADSQKSPLLFRDLVHDFLVQQRHQVKKSTYAHYTNLIDSHILPQLGEIPLNNLTAQVIEAYAGEKLDSGKLDHSGGLSPKTVKDLLSLIRLILKYGLRNDVVDQKTLFFSGPRAVKNEIRIFSKKHQEQLEAMTMNAEDNQCFGIYLCLYTGLRLGEICALQWRDINLDKGYLSVDRTILRIRNPEDTGQKTIILIDTPKTTASKRVIPLSAHLNQLLMQHKKEEYQDHTYFLTGTDHYIEPRNYYAKYKKYLSSAGIPQYTFHALRHSFATRCIEKGADPKTLSELLGHADVKITLDRYVHPSMERKRSCMELLSPRDISTI